MKLKISYTFVIYFIIIYFANLLNSYIFFFIAILLHESVHAVVGLIFGLKIEEIHISAIGVSLKFERFNVSLYKKIGVLIAGPMSNLILVSIIKNEWWLIANLFIGLFNLIPIYPLDGGKIWYYIVKENKWNDKNILIVYKSFLIFFLIIALVIYVNFQNIQMIFIGIYLLSFYKENDVELELQRY